MTEGYREGELCMRCQGRCCRTMGCSLSPEDMIRALKDRSATWENIETLLQECNYAIDSFQNGGHAFYFLRMRHKCFTFIGVDAMGECSMLTEHGCSLPYEDRPKRTALYAGDDDCRLESLSGYTRQHLEGVA